MNKICVVLICAFVSWLTACGQAPAPDRERVMQEQAAALVEELLPRHDLKLEEITTDALWDEMGVQLFANTCEQPYEYVFAVSGDAALVLKYAWGGYYFDYALADLDGDRQKEMVYAFDWGSGILRTVPGVLRADMSQLPVNAAPEAEGLWFLRNLSAEGDIVTLDVSPAMGGAPEEKGIRGYIAYIDGEYVMDLER